MKACSTAGGGVMFIPESIERKERSISYKDLVKEKEPAAPEERPFGEASEKRKADQKAA